MRCKHAWMVRKHSRVAGENTSNNSTLFMELLSHLKSDINFASKGEEKKEKKECSEVANGDFHSFSSQEGAGRTRRFMSSYLMFKCYKKPCFLFTDKTSISANHTQSSVPF